MYRLSRPKGLSVLVSGILFSTFILGCVSRRRFMPICQQDETALEVAVRNALWTIRVHPVTKKRYT